MIMLSPSFYVHSRCFAVLDPLGIVFSCGHWDRTFRATEVESGKALQSLSYHHGIVTCLDVSDIGGGAIHVGASSVQAVLVTGSDDCTAAVWGIQSGGIGDAGAMVGGRSGGRSGGSGISVGGGIGGEYRPITPYPLLVLYGHDAPVTSVSVSATLGVVVTGSADGTANMYSLYDGSYIRSVGRSLSAAGTLSAGSPGPAPRTPSLRVETDTGAEEDGVECGACTWAGLSTSSGVIALYFGHASQIKVFSLNGRLLASTSEINEQLHALLFSEDGKYIITGGTGRVVAVREIDSLSLVNKIRGETRPSPLVPRGLPAFEASINSLSFTPGERHLMVGLDNGTVRVLALDAQYLRDRLQGRLNSLGF